MEENEDEKEGDFLIFDAVILLFFSFLPTAEIITRPTGKIDMHTPATEGLIHTKGRTQVQQECPSFEGNRPLVLILLTVVTLTSFDLHIRCGPRYDSVLLVC